MVDWKGFHLVGQKVELKVDWKDIYLVDLTVEWMEVNTVYH